MGNFVEELLRNYFEFGPGVYYFKLWQQFCSAEQNHLGNFVRGPYQENFCEFIFEFWLKVLEMPSKDFASFSSGRAKSSK